MYKPSTVVGLLAPLALVPPAMLLPIEISFENGPIENFQVILLFGSSFFALSLMLRSSSQSARSFDLFCALLFLLLGVRELSWGRVFYPIGVDEKGPVFVSIADYAWRLEAHAFMIIVGASMLYLLVRRIPLGLMLIHPLPRTLLTSVFVCVLVQYFGEHGWLIGKAHGQVLEELSETIIYALQPALCSYYHSVLDRK